MLVDSPLDRLWKIRMKNCCARLGLIALLLPALLPVRAADQADDYPAALPPPALVRDVLARQPRVAAARAGISAEQANSRRLAAGTYEWSVRATAQRRNEASGPHYHESEIAVERPLRWMSKAGKDVELGDHGVRLSEARLGDAWHESARGLHKSWFDWLREARAALRLQQYAQVLDQQLAIVRKRVQAGDAPRMETMLAETERNRAYAAYLQAAQRRDVLAAGLRGRYPGLEPHMPEALPAPRPLAGDEQAWRLKILEDNHEIELAEAEARIDRLSAERAALDRLPDPTVGMHYAQERDRQERIFGVSVSIPIPGAARREQVLASLSRADMAEERAREVRVRVEGDALQVSMRAAASQALSAQLAGVSEQAENNAALVARAYALGEAPLNDTLLARRQALDALTVAEQARIDALEAQARLLLDMHAIWSLHAE
jgi:outer membrane protein TolC